MTQAVEALAQSLDAQLYAVHVFTPPDVVPFSGYEGLIGLEGLPYTVYDPTIQQERAEAETHAFERFLQARFSQPVLHAIRRGEPAAVIIDEAREHKADLIVLGHRRRGFVENLFVGSVASAVLKESTRPVLLFPMVDDDAR